MGTCVGERWVVTAPPRRGQPRRFVARLPVAGADEPAHWLRYRHRCAGGPGSQARIRARTGSAGRRADCARTHARQLDETSNWHLRRSSSPRRTPGAMLGVSVARVWSNGVGLGTFSVPTLPAEHANANPRQRGHPGTSRQNYGNGLGLAQFLGTGPNDRCALFALFASRVLSNYLRQRGLDDGISQYPRLV
jgi:hypothetical protein